MYAAGILSVKYSINRKQYKCYFEGICWFSTGFSAILSAIFLQPGGLANGRKLIFGT